MSPTRSRQVNALHRANVDCVSALVSLQDSIENDDLLAQVSKDVEDRLREWIDAFTAMRRLERTLLQEAFTIELGGEALIGFCQDRSSKFQLGCFAGAWFSQPPVASDKAATVLRPRSLHQHRCRGEFVFEVVTVSEPLLDLATCLQNPFVSEVG